MREYSIDVSKFGIYSQKRHLLTLGGNISTLNLEPEIKFVIQRNIKANKILYSILEKVTF